MELGCGAGMLGVLLQRVGAAGVCLTDGDSQTLCNCLHNLRINEAQVHGAWLCLPDEGRH